MESCAFEKLVEEQKKLQGSDRGPKGEFLPRRSDHDIRKRILLDADVICSTLSGAASHALLEASLFNGALLGNASGGNREHFKFDAVIVDESCQAVEPSTLIPFKFINDVSPVGGSRTIVVLIGDPCQLAPVVLGLDAQDRSRWRFKPTHETSLVTLVL